MPEVSPQPWGRHWEMSDEDTDLGKGTAPLKQAESYLLPSVSMGRTRTETRKHTRHFQVTNCSCYRWERDGEGPSELYSDSVHPLWSFHLAAHSSAVMWEGTGVLPCRKWCPSEIKTVV